MRTSSWYTHHSGARLKSDDDGWRKTGVLQSGRSVSVGRRESRGRGERERDAPLDERLVALLRVLLGRVAEVAARDRTTHTVVVLAAREDVVLVPASARGTGQLARSRSVRAPGSSDPLQERAAK